MPIKKLPQDIINKIAAGEVVERPASVIKELIENSLDAGAKNILVEITRGGKGSMAVADDGSGMSAEDARMSLVEHATSKIERLEDLFSVGTFGFRGEALSSISAVSRFKMLTKPKESLVGTELFFENGEISFREAASVPGTKIEVKDLFYNIPARKAYLKTDFTEFNHVLEIFYTFALANVDVGFKLFHDGRLIHNFSAAGGWRSRIAQVLGREFGDNLIRIDHKEEYLCLKGYLGKPQIARTNRKGQYLFVNKRGVNDNMISRAALDAFYSLIPKGEYPCFVMDLEIDPEKIDVNVHPRKMEVRFSDPQMVFRFVRRALAEALRQGDMLKKDNRKEEQIYSLPSREWPEAGRASAVRDRDYYFKEKEAVDREFPRFDGSDNYDHRIGDMSRQNGFTRQTIDWDEEEKRQDRMAISDWRLIGQAMNSYIIVESESRGLLIIDQHAADERVNYERLKKDLADRKIESQRMLIPITVELSHREVNELKDNLGIFNRLGFEIEEFGGNTFNISAVPAILKNKDPKEAVMELVSEIQEKGAEADSLKIDHILKTMACKSAIKFGDALSEEEMFKLLRDLEKIDNKMACCHGRPVVQTFAWDRIDKGFRR